MKSYYDKDNQGEVKVSWYQRWHQNPRHKVYHWAILLIFILLMFSWVTQSVQQVASVYSSSGVSYVSLSDSSEPVALETPAVASYAADHILVKFKPDKKPDDRFLNQHNLSAAKRLIEGRVALQGLDRLYSVKFPSGANMPEIINALKNSPNVEYAEPDYTVTATLIPNDTSFATQQWDFNNTGQSGGRPDADIDAPEAWDVTTGTGATTVAVIDTGIDYNHPDLAANIWTNPGEIPGNGIDDDHNGYIDDVHGYDFVNNDGDPMDDHSHGTHCAGTIGAVGNNGVGVAGIDWNVKIMAVKFLNATGTGSIGNAILALNYAVMMGAKVSNNSWGGTGFSASLQNAITSARSSGHIFVAAAGNNATNNDTTPFYPASYTSDNVVAVAATDRTDAMASFSNYGATSVDLAAPGYSIYSTIPVSMGSYAYKSGTSMAAPHVTGAVALVSDLHPGWTYSQVIHQIFSSVDPLTSLTGKVATGGRLNISGALGGIVTNPNPDTTPPTVSITSPVSGTTYTSAQTVTITADASDNAGITKVEFYDKSNLDKGIGNLIATVMSAPYTYNWGFASSNNGTHTWTATAYDANNNSSSSNPVSLTVSIPLDTTPPTVSITSPVSGTTYTSAQTVTITATASANAGITKVEFYDSISNLITTVMSAPYTYNWSFASSNNGTHTWTAKVYDATGSTGVSTAVNLTVNISTPDTVAPVVSISGPSIVTTNNKTFTATAWDNVGIAKVEFYLDNALTPFTISTTTPYTAVISVTGKRALSSGAHVIKAKAYDAAGNNASAQMNFTK